MRRGVSLGVDVGTVRIGVAACDADGIMAFPLCTVKVDRDHVPAVARIAELAAEYEARDIYVGLPLHLSGAVGASAEMAINFAHALRIAVAPREVYMVDERLSSVAAGNLLHQAGRSTKSQRAIVDQAAAQLVLQQVLDAQSGSADPPAFATPVTPPETGRNGDNPREPAV